MLLILTDGFLTHSAQVLYHDAWQNVVQEAISYYDTWISSYAPTTIPIFQTCTICGQPINVEAEVIRLLRRLGAGLEALADLDATFSFCSHVPQTLFSSWRRFVEGNIKHTPTLSSFSGSSSTMTRSVAPRHVSVVLSYGHFSLFSLLAR
jgi:hypothetical protein